MKKVRLALVGCGGRGVGVTQHFRHHPNCEVTALADLFPRGIEYAMKELQLKDVKTYRDFETMLKSAPVDAVFFSSDPIDHADLACVAMKAGRHVCTEVPAAYTLDQCWNLVNTVKKTGCKYQLMEQTRYWGFVDVWKGMRDRGELGHVCLAQGEYIHYERWDTWMDADTGKIFYDIKPPAGKNIVPTWRNRMLCNPIYYLPHTLSPLLKILDDRVLRVSCMGTRKGSYTYPDEVLGWSDLQYALMHTAGDTVMLVGAGFSMPNINRGQTYSHWYELRGNKGNVTSPRSKTDNFQKWQIGMDTFEVMNLSTVPLDANASQADSGHGGADFKPVDTFLQAILNDTTPPMDVYLTAEMTAPAIIAAESARRNGEAMDVPDFRAGKKTAASSRKRRPKKGNVS